jgi:MFS transporter, DHA1 family, multidrug resistance protein
MDILKNTFRKSTNFVKPSLFILVFMISVGPFGDTEYTPSLPHIAHSFGVTYNSVQFTMTVYLIGFAIFQLLYGPLSDRFGRRPITFFGLTSYIIGTLICCFSPSLVPLLLGRFVQGVGACVGSVITGAAIRDSFDLDARNKVFTIVNAAFALAPAIGPVVGGILDVYFGWRYNFYLLLTLGILLIIAVYFFFPETNHHKDPTALKPKNILGHILTLVKNKCYLPLASMMGCCIAIIYASLVEAPSLTIDMLHMPPQHYYIVSAYLAAGFICGSVICGLLLRVWWRKFIVLLGLGFMIFGSLLMGTFAYFNIVDITTMLGSLMFVFLGIAVILPICSAAILEPFEHIAGAAYALLGFIQMGFGALGTVAISFMHDGSPMALPYVSLAASILALIIFLLFAIRLKAIAGKSA